MSHYLALFLYISLEVSFTNWLPPAGKDVIRSSGVAMDEDTTDAKAAQLLSFFAIAMMAGRLLSSFVPGLTDIGDWFIAIAAAICVLIIFALIRTDSLNTARALAAAAGFFFAPIFPTTVGVTFAKFEPAVYGSIFGIIFAVGLLGGATVPKAIGNMAKGEGVQRAMRLLIPFAALLILLGILL